MPRIDGGRVAAFEVLLATSAVRNLIRDAKAEQLSNVISTSQRQGMQTMDASVQALVGSGVVAASA